MLAESRPFKSFIVAWNLAQFQRFYFHGGFAYITIDPRPENAPELAREQSHSLDDVPLA